MATEESKASSDVSAAVSSDKALVITRLKPYDVLLGKGSGINDYIGNQIFRRLVKEKRDEYNSAVRNETTSRIAKDFLKHIHSLGGRFLKQKLDKGEKVVQCSVEECVWYVVTYDVALEKCKQAFFRQGRKAHKADRGEVGGSGEDGDSSLTGRHCCGFGDGNNGIHFDNVLASSSAVSLPNIGDNTSGIEWGMLNSIFMLSSVLLEGRQQGPSAHPIYASTVSPRSPRSPYSAGIGFFRSQWPNERADSAAPVTSSQHMIRGVGEATMMTYEAGRRDGASRTENNPSISEGELSSSTPDENEAAFALLQLR